MYPMLFDEAQTNKLSFVRLAQANESPDAHREAMTEFLDAVKGYCHHCHRFSCCPPSGAADGSGADVISITCLPFGEARSPARDEPILTRRTPNGSTRPIASILFDIVCFDNEVPLGAVRLALEMEKPLDHTEFQELCDRTLRTLDVKARIPLEDQIYERVHLWRSRLDLLFRRLSSKFVSFISLS